PSGVQGRSLAPVMFDARKRNESSVPVFAETVYGGFQATEEMAKTRLRCVRTDAWKLIEIDSPQTKTFQLFDLLTDPKELKNVYDENGRIASALRAWLIEWKRDNVAKRKAVMNAAAAVSIQGGLPVCPEMIFPYDGAVLRFEDRNGIVRASWTGSPGMPYVVEYDVGRGVHHLSGSFVTFGNQREFGPYSHEIWSALAVRNPWRVRISPDTNPRCWSEWVEFTFE
ncbi:MAG: DUF4976 domain-containing protein, partial [Candidatus Lindowbacteria bacterium]|nr:DUF4976 domain-containing protein [Candidatus Lindowbacteria bacterium]